jgi:hypothetical protein
VSALGVAQTSLFFLRENRFIQRIVRSLGGIFDVDEPVGAAALFRPDGGCDLV